MKIMSAYPKITEAIFSVISYQDGNITGWLAHPRLQKPSKVRSLTEFILTLSDLLKQEAALADYRINEYRQTDQQEVLATLRIQILFQEHYTWQGCVFWEEQETKIAFRSVLDLIRILDDLLAE